MQQGDFGSVSYYQYPQSNPHLQNPNPNPNPPDLHPNPLPPTYASAPPFSPNYPSSDYANLPSAYPPYPQNPDPVHTHAPTAPSYSTNPNLPAFNPPPPPPQQPPPAPSYAQHPPGASGEAPAPYQPPPPQQQQQQSYFPSYDQHQSGPNYAPPQPQPQPSPIQSNPNSNFNPIPTYSSSSSYGHLGSSVPPAYDNLYESSVKFDQSGGYFDENSSRYGGYDRTRSDSGSELLGKRFDGGMTRYDQAPSVRDESYGDGVYAYEGGKVQPYGARGTSSKSSTWLSFDDYGRSISFPSGKEQAGSAGSPKIVRAVPKVETQQDAKGGVQKFRVKLLPEGGGGTMDVLCQIALDGIRMLDPTSGRTLRIYPLDNVTRCDVTESSTFTFWAKSSVDVEPRRIRLQSNSYTTNTLLDIVTAATVQLKEMGGRTKPADYSKPAELPMEKKKGLGDWMNMLKPANEEKDHWVPDEAIIKCTACGADFGAFVRRHHCRNCGDIFCNKCTNGRIALTTDENAQPVRVCDRCMAEVTQRLTNAKEVASKPAGLQSHEDLAKKLQEEMERNRKVSSGSRSDGSGRRMKEVACPTCTVHLQVQVPSSGSETIECGVCQHPFLVNAH